MNFNPYFNSSNDTVDKLSTLSNPFKDDEEQETQPHDPSEYVMNEAFDLIQVINTGFDSQNSYYDMKIHQLRQDLLQIEYEQLQAMDQKMEDDT